MGKIPSTNRYLSGVGCFMSDVIDLKKKLNLKWKSNPVFIEGFDYEKPEYADVPDGLTWALPIHESVNKPEEVQRQKRLHEEVKSKIKVDEKISCLKSRKFSVI